MVSACDGRFQIIISFSRGGRLIVSRGLVTRAGLNIRGSGRGKLYVRNSGGRGDSHLEKELFKI